MSRITPNLEEKLAVLEHTEAELHALFELTSLTNLDEISQALSAAISQTENQLAFTRREALKT
ncbi:hypothetical protein PMI41_01817 [Phyllobacterium sp. YR531]|nr:hypothetical protein PMI41_01817 [Phyllobacterium sp. YR531]